MVLSILLFLSHFFRVPLSLSISHVHTRARLLSLCLSPVQKFDWSTWKPKCRKIDTVLPCRKFSGEISAVLTAAVASATVFALLHIYIVYAIHNPQTTQNCVCVYGQFCGDFKFCFHAVHAKPHLCSSSSTIPNRIHIFFISFFFLCRIEYILRTHCIYAQHIIIEPNWLTQFKLSFRLLYCHVILPRSPFASLTLATTLFKCLFNFSSWKSSLPTCKLPTIVWSIFVCVWVWVCECVLWTRCMHVCSY